jgi:hypothetical protein
MDLDPKAVRLGQDVTIPRNSLRDLNVSVTRQRHSRGALVGLGLGAVAGGALGALIGAIAVEPCREEEGVLLECFLEPTSHGEAAALYGLLMGTAGALSGIIVGALIGTKETTIYRFRPDTAEQMSVVIGVGPREK